MLRARRLRLMQSPLPGWRTTTPAAATATAMAMAVLAAGRAATALPRARCFSSAAASRSNGHEDDHASVAQEATQQNKTEGQEQTRQGGADENTGDLERAFRRVKSEDRRTKIALRARSKRLAVPEQHLHANITGKMTLQSSGTSDAEDESRPGEGPEFPWLAKDSANAVPGVLPRAAAAQPEVDVTAQNPKSSHLEREVPDQVVFDVRAKISADTQAQAAMRAPFTAADSVSQREPKSARAKDLHAELEAVGKSPPFPKRNYGQNNFSINTIPTRNTREPTSDSSGGPNLIRRCVSGMSPLERSITNPTSKKPRFKVVSTSKPYNSAKTADQTHERAKTKLPVFDRPSREKRDILSSRSDAPDPLDPEVEGKIDSSSGAVLDTPIKPRQIDNSINPRLPEEAQAKREEPIQAIAVPMQEELAPPDSLGPEVQGEIDSSSGAAPDTPMKPRQTDSSIYSRLFPEEAQAKIEEPEQAVAVPAQAEAELAPPDTLNPEVQGGIDSSSAAPDTPIKPRQTDNSMYWRLFPEEAQAKTEEQQATAVLAQEELAPPDSLDSSLLVSLRHEVRSWVPTADREEVSVPELGEYGSHSTVVIISAVSNSLIDSDFFRIIPEGRYVEGWAGGLVKIVQARHPFSYQPVGQYFLMFHSRPPAVAYAEEVKRLHGLSRRLLHAPGSSGRKTARGKLENAPVSPQPFLTEEEKTAVRSFTLCAPDAELRVSVRMWSLEVVNQLASKTNIADVVQALRPEAETPARVLLTVGGHYGTMTARELWLALRDDGLERGTPWVLRSTSEGIMPVRMRSVTDLVARATRRVLLRAEAEPFPLDVDAEDAAAAEREIKFSEPGGGGEEEGGGRPDGEPGDEENPQQPTAEWEGGGNGDGGPIGQDERFNRFVLTFTQPVDARRFVRSWHKRAIWDTESMKSVVIDAVVLI